MTLPEGHDQIPLQGEKALKAIQKRGSNNLIKKRIYRIL